MTVSRIFYNGVSNTYGKDIEETKTIHVDLFHPPCAGRISIPYVDMHF